MICNLILCFNMYPALFSLLYLLTVLSFFWSTQYSSEANYGLFFLIPQLHIRRLLKMLTQEGRKTRLSWIQSNFCGYINMKRSSQVTTHSLSSTYSGFNKMHVQRKNGPSSIHELALDIQGQKLLRRNLCGDVCETWTWVICSPLIIWGGKWLEV